jgi:sulfatase maturation enzyme AslB (radical SAM superfamily)
MRCSLLDSQIYIGTNGQYRMCCTSTEPANKETVWTHSPQGWLNSDTIVDAKKQFKNNQWPTSCNRCKLEEEAGLVSRRLTKEDYGPGITHLDLRIGNSCNLKCISCWPGASSSIADEVLRMESQGIIPVYPEKTDSVLNWYDNEIFSNFENLPLKEVYFAGGEPMMVKYLDQILEKLDPSVTLRFNTNATIMNPKVLQLLKKFKKVIMSFSIDGIGKRNEYIRYGSKWNAIEKNVMTYAEFCKVDINPCISVLNAAYYDEIIDWSTNLGFKIYENMLLQPDWLHVKNAPDQLKERFTKVGSWKDHLADPIQQELFCSNIKKLDKFRKINIADYLPEVAKAYNICC